MKGGVIVGEIERIVDQHRRSFAGGAWHGPAVFELLRGVSAAEAAARPLTGRHSIAEIALHVAAWEEVAKRRLAGERVELTTEQDWPPVQGGDEQAWARALETLERRHRELQQAIAGLSEKRLDERVPGQEYSVYHMLHGVVQHGLYHAGQIALLRR